MNQAVTASCFENKSL